MTDLPKSAKPGPKTTSAWVRKAQAHLYAGMSRAGFDSFCRTYLAELTVSRPSQRVVLIQKQSIDNLLMKLSTPRNDGTLFE